MVYSLYFQDPEHTVQKKKHKIVTINMDNLFKKFLKIIPSVL